MSKPEKKRPNSPFTEEQESWTMLKYGALRNYVLVRRKFGTHFKLSPHASGFLLIFFQKPEFFNNEPSNKIFERVYVWNLTRRKFKVCPKLSSNLKIISEGAIFQHSPGFLFLCERRICLLLFWFRHRIFLEHQMSNNI